MSTLAATTDRQTLDPDKAVFLHASVRKLAVGTVLTPRSERRSPDLVEQVLESQRPPHRPSRQHSVFMAWDLDILEVMGLADDAYLYFVRPIGPYARLDAVWMNRATDIFNETYGNPDSTQITKMERWARSYWSGRRTNEPQLEILAARAEIILPFC